MLRLACFSHGFPENSALIPSGLDLSCFRLVRCQGYEAWLSLPIIGWEPSPHLRKPHPLAQDPVADSPGFSNGPLNRLYSSKIVLTHFLGDCMPLEEHGNCSAYLPKRDIQPVFREDPEHPCYSYSNDRLQQRHCSLTPELEISLIGLALTRWRCCFPF